MIDIGHGPPLVLVPGVQARWEWLRPAVDALAPHFRVLTFTLAGDPTSRHAFDRHLGFDSFVAQIDRVLEEAGVEGAIVCGVSYGGLIALRYAALRPGRVRALVLVSALAPGYVPDRRVCFYSRAPLLLAPLFCVGAWRRTRAEIRAALPGWRDRLRFAAGQVRRVLGSPMSPSRMAARMRLLERIDFHETARRVTAPVLVITGDERLDRAVPVAHTKSYGQMLPQAEFAQLDRSGHLGTVTRPDAFAEAVRAFVARRIEDTPSGRRRAVG